MKPLLIVTRPEPDGARFVAAVLKAVSVDFILSPLMEIVPLDAHCQADEVIFTSTNGVAQAARLGLRSGRAWCVGDRTAEMAAAAGFETASAHGTAEDLLEMIVACAPKSKLAHVRGSEARGDIGPRLRANCIDCIDVVAYAQKPVPLSTAARDAIEGGSPCIIPLFSPRTASLLLSSAKIGPLAKILAMSKAVALALGDFDAEVISQPNGEAMLKAVITHCRTRL